METTFQKREIKLMLTILINVHHTADNICGSETISIPLILHVVTF